jgi:hypothetical protein
LHPAIFCGRLLNWKRFGTDWNRDEELTVKAKENPAVGTCRVLLEGLNLVSG